MTVKNAFAMILFISQISSKKLSSTDKQQASDGYDIITTVSQFTSELAKLSLDHMEEGSVNFVEEPLAGYNEGNNTYWQKITEEFQNERQGLNPRNLVQKVTFKSEFSCNPQVFLTVRNFFSDGHRNLRYAVRSENITKNSFDVKLYTGYNTILRIFYVDYIAFCP